MACCTLPSDARGITALVSLVVLWCLTAHLLIQTFGGCRKILRSAIRRCKELGRCGWLPRRQSLADPLAKISEHHVLRVKRATLFLSCCIACIALPLVLSLLWDANCEVSLRILWHCGFWAIMVLTNIIITRWPRCMVLSLAYLLGMTLIMTSPAWTYILDELAAVAVGGLSRLACLSCGPTPTLVFILNAAHSFNTYLNTESSDIAVMFDAFISLCLVSSYGFLRRVSDADAAKTLALGEKDAEQRACLMMLRSVCDAVVELDEKLKIVGDSRHLHCWLLHGRESSPEDEELQQFVQEADRELFIRELRKERQGLTAAAAFHLKMRDSSGTVVPVECFHVRFQSALGQRHLLGLREYGEMSGSIVLSQHVQRPTRLASHRAPERHEHVVEFDPFTWRCQGTSEAFRRLFSERRKVLEYLAVQSRESFERTVIDRVNYLTYSDNQIDTVTIEVQMAGGGPCSCILMVKKDDEDKMVAQLHLLDLELPVRKQASRESGSILEIRGEKSSLDRALSGSILGIHEPEEAVAKNTKMMAL
ncbi:unnamed protein product [Effrenium voratum]|uniref:Uncharacterized protein n=2 Tax=Effrenium voratum TaxID=2562239 RepID=A0AA36IAP9_9DINO|nr:unnamed protein product [Effrenium voratum]CAJ1447028.1 unnamed protein product [Effrenium voratum]